MFFRKEITNIGKKSRQKATPFLAALPQNNQLSLAEVKSPTACHSLCHTISILYDNAGGSVYIVVFLIQNSVKTAQNFCAI